MEGNVFILVERVSNSIKLLCLDHCRHFSQRFVSIRRTIVLIKFTSADVVIDDESLKVEEDSRKMMKVLVSWRNGAKLFEVILKIYDKLRDMKSKSNWEFQNEQLSRQFFDGKSNKWLKAVALIQLLNHLGTVKVMNDKVPLETFAMPSGSDIYELSTSLSFVWV